MADQTTARRIIKTSVRSQPLSLRQIAERIGLNGHSSLSRFLSGKSKLSLALILSLCRELGIEGRPYEKILGSLIPSEYLCAEKRGPLRPTGHREEDDTDNRVALAGFFFREKMPIIYETLKLIGPCQMDVIAESMHPRTRVTKEDVSQCLRLLSQIELVTEENQVWRVIDREKDMVLPTKHSKEIGMRMMRYNFLLNREFLGEAQDVRLMRAVFTTVRTQPNGSSMENIKPLLLRFQDDALALQGPNDNRVICLFVSAMEVARKGKRREKSG